MDLFIKVLRRYYILISVFLLLMPAAALALLSPSSEAIPDSILALSSGYVIVVDKQYQKMYVFHKNGSYSKVFEAPCATGKKPGSKQVSGDAKTPTGIFFATKNVSNPGPPETYGSLAFHLDYPTLLDKKAGRNGHNIWIHGTTKPLSPFQSNGCVVLSEKDLRRLPDVVFLNKTPVIISESIKWVSPNAVSPAKDELENILTAWHKAYIEGNLNNMDALYLKGSEIQGKRRAAMGGRMAAVKKLNRHFSLQPRDVSILQHGNNAVILFDQIAAVNNDNSFQGEYNKLVLEKINNRWLIIDDISAPAPKPAATASAPVSTPVAAPVSAPVSVSVQTKTPNDAPVRALIAKWAKSWQSGDMKNYRNCYAPNFQSRGMNLNQWIDHKINVRKNSRNIRIRIENIRVSAGASNATAALTQHYSSSILQSKGQKKLELIKINGEWKINREITG